jgi:hypothetical protein
MKLVIMVVTLAVFSFPGKTPIEIKDEKNAINVAKTKNLITFRQGSILITQVNILTKTLLLMS